MELKEIENKIGQLQYEISCLGLDKEELTGVDIRMEELKELVKKLTIPVVSGICSNEVAENIVTELDAFAKSVHSVEYGLPIVDFEVGKTILETAFGIERK